SLELLQCTWGSQAVGNGVNQAVRAPADLGQLSPLLLNHNILFSALAIHLEDEGADELLDQIRMHEVLLQSFQNEIVENMPRDTAPIRAGAHLTRSSAGEIIATDRGERASTAPAANQTGQQVSRPALLPKSRS